MHRSRQQCLVAKCVGLSVTVRVRVRARARECVFFVCAKSDKHLCLTHVNGSCDVHGIRTTVHDVL